MSRSASSSAPCAIRHKGFLGYDSRPAAIRNFIAYSLQRLGVDHIDIYRPARLDPDVPIEETIGAMADMVKAGYIRHIGLSEVGSETIRSAHAVHPIVDLQIEYSLVSRGIESDILQNLPRARHRHHRLWRIGARADQRTLVEGPLRRAGFPANEPALPGRQSRRQSGTGRIPARDCGEIGATPAQVAIAWVAAQGNDIVPLVGARRRDRLTEALGALEVKLTPAHLAALGKAFPPGVAAGARYPESQLAHMDSEKKAS